ncbi:hypothetical protein CKM354_000810500 [Cercospora kikuchii]|uniref:FAD-binding PCMH-type domain-containing protein n=1 Tax=Cercospora kikuchii TaxID=84275 RepID=A0A9P3CLI7_9PEZI|nr:uncharacterized protein CKM354_000810500 [Cercospora kikuchii]GIZ44921.1 hypothetical protein CKM354_000810500 [Cercospora kikuchii]
MLTAGFPLLFAAPLVAAQLLSQVKQQPLQAPTACQLLAATFPDSVAKINDKQYNESQSAYWSAQQAFLQPDCRFYPMGSREIQEALADILLPYNVTIAVTSGGRSSNTGASNVQDGITIDMSRLNHTYLVDDGQAVAIGVGARWGDVYRTLAKHNLTVAGSRIADDHVGGHALAGGISWLANEHGWTCDGMHELGLVTPQGQILWANEHWNEDLWWGAKGSLGAFGIVTEVKLPTIKNRKMFGGITTHAADQAPLLFEALQATADNANKDPAQSAYLSFGRLPGKKDWRYRAHLLNTEPRRQNGALDMFMNIPSRSNSLRAATLVDITEENAKYKTPGLRRLKFTLTAKSSVQNMQILHDIIKAYTAKLVFDGKAQVITTYEPITVPHLQACSSQTNIFGLHYADGPLLLVSIEFSWSDRQRDDYFEQEARKLRSAMQQELSSLRALHKFIYPAYASTDQDPFAGLSPYTQGMLREVKNRYDPDGLWKKHVPGIWHV